jgi:predicted ferric reductase
MNIEDKQISNETKVNSSDTHRISGIIATNMLPVDTNDNEEESTAILSYGIDNQYRKQRSKSMVYNISCKHHHQHQHQHQHQHLWGRQDTQNRSKSMDFCPKNISNTISFNSQKGLILHLHRQVNDDIISTKVSKKHSLTMENDVSFVKKENYDGGIHNETNEYPPFVFLDEKMNATPRISILSHHHSNDDECSSNINLTETQKGSTIQSRPRATLITWQKDAATPNQPHPSLEFPPLYFLLHRFPTLTKAIDCFYNTRWRILQVLQRKLPFSRTVLRKASIFLTIADLISMLPLLVISILGIVYSFIYPSVSISGHAARTPLILAFVTAMRNSPLTLLLGLPFERAIWYHKWLARIAYVNGLFHTYVCFVHPTMSMSKDTTTPATSLNGKDPNFGMFLFADQVNTGGSLLILFMSMMILSAFSFVRRRFFEVFHYLHMVFVASMILCAFYHTGITVPICATLSWGLDLFIRKVYMPLYRYPKYATLRVISDTVLELCFPKSPGFDYNPGQYIYICVPEISLLQWHPFSLSSSPEQKIVTLHIRKAGHWTSSLYEIAKTQNEISILLEGPYGSVGVNLSSDQYKSIMLISGGIGVTPMQALCNQLMFEYRKGIRELNKLSFVWIERDPHIMPKVDVIRRRINSPVLLMNDDIEYGCDLDKPEEESLASALLSIIPPCTMTDDQFEQEYPDADSDDELEDFEHNQYLSSLDLNKHNIGDDTTDNDTMNQTFLDEAYNEINQFHGPGQPLDLQVYLTSKEASQIMMSNYPFVHHNRPDIQNLFGKMRAEALAKGERCVAVCICAPERLVILCKKACAKFSDHSLQFDLHYEVFS